MYRRKAKRWSQHKNLFRLNLHWTTNINSKTSSSTPPSSKMNAPLTNYWLGSPSLRFNGPTTILPAMWAYTYQQNVILQRKLWGNTHQLSRVKADPSNQLFLSSSQFPVGYPVHGPCPCIKWEDIILAIFDVILTCTGLGKREVALILPSDSLWPHWTRVHAT